MPKLIAILVLVAALGAAGCATSDPGASWAPTIQVGAPPPPPLPPPAPVAPAVPKPYIYPNRGQTAQQEEFDRGQCYSWAVQQSGFDPANPRVATAPPPAPSAPQGGMFRGAAGGAALGAVGGAIGGNAGEGAAIGAGVGALFGLMRRAEWQEHQQQQQQNYASQQQWALNQGQANYHRAFGTCMAGRGYTIS
jgi:hypothetical protein